MKPTSGDKLSWPAITAHLAPIRRACQIVPLTLYCHDRALHLAERYKLPIYDALILASAIGAGCTQLVSEDFQHGQTFDRCIRVRNPFKSKA
jgi:predicted nucleic acid-binding protein